MGFKERKKRTKLEVLRQDRKLGATIHAGGQDDLMIPSPSAWYIPTLPLAARANPFNSRFFFLFPVHAGTVAAQWARILFSILSCRPLTQGA